MSQMPLSYNSSNITKCGKKNPSVNILTSWTTSGGMAVMQPETSFLAYRLSSQCVFSGNCKYFMYNAIRPTHSYVV
jgi:hypothetical protein